MKITILALLFTASIALAGDAEGGFNTELPRLHWKVSEAEKALVADLKNLGAETYIADCPNEAQMAKIHQDEKLLDEAVEQWEAANQ
jgi:hypothetical protein